MSICIDFYKKKCSRPLQFTSVHALYGYKVVALLYFTQILPDTQEDI